MGGVRGRAGGRGVDRVARRLAPIVAVAVVATAAGTVSGCGAVDSAGAGPVVRDSAGITIVENTSPLWAEGEAWRLSAEPSVDIGVLEGDPEYQLFEVSGAARLPDGRIVIANGGTHELRFYDAAGRFLRSVGREGEGPGEFRIIGPLFVARDSLYVHDYRLDRISVFDTRGEFIRTFRLEAGESGSGWPLGLFGDGTVLVRGSRVFRASEVVSGIVADTLPHYRYGPEGAILDTVGRWPMADQYVEGDGRSLSVGTAAFGKPASIVTHGEHLFVGIGARYEIRKWTLGGRLERIVRRDVEPLPVTSEDIARYKEERLAVADEAWRAFNERRLAGMPFPERMPAYADLKVDSGGNLWVEAYRRPGEDPPRWSVFDPDGRWLGVVETPPGLEIYEIRDDYVLGGWRDAFEVEHVRLYGLDKPAGERVAALGARAEGGGRR